VAQSTSKEPLTMSIRVRTLGLASVTARSAARGVQYGVLTYAYLVTWILGGLVLVTVIFMRPRRRPYWLALGPMAFGATGFLSLGFGVPQLPLTLVYAGLAALLGGGLGVGIERLGARAASQPAL
jgi:hypothetical protein